MEEGTVGDDVGATAGDSDDSLQQSSVQLLETVDEPLTHDITGKFYIMFLLYSIEWKHISK